MACPHPCRSEEFVRWDPRFFAELKASYSSRIVRGSSPHARHGDHGMPRRPRQHLDEQSGLRRRERLAPSRPTSRGRSNGHQRRRDLRGQLRPEPLRQCNTAVRQPHRQRPRPTRRPREPHHLRVDRLRVSDLLPRRRPTRPVRRPPRLRHHPLHTGAGQRLVPNPGDLHVFRRRHCLNWRPLRQPGHHVQHQGAPLLIRTPPHVPGGQRQNVPHGSTRARGFLKGATAEPARRRRVVHRTEGGFDYVRG